MNTMVISLSTPETILAPLNIEMLLCFMKHFYPPLYNLP